MNPIGGQPKKNGRTRKLRLNISNLSLKFKKFLAHQQRVKHITKRTVHHDIYCKVGGREEESLDSKS